MSSVFSRSEDSTHEGLRRTLHRFDEPSLSMKTKPKIVGGVGVEAGLILGGLKLGHGFFGSSEAEKNGAKVILSLAICGVLFHPF